MTKLQRSHLLNGITCLLVMLNFTFMAATDADRPREMVVALFVMAVGALGIATLHLLRALEPGR